jgi:hypothetical protein
MGLPAIDQLDTIAEFGRLVSAPRQKLIGRSQ